MQAVINKANRWRTVHDLLAGSKPKNAKSLEETLEAKTKKLEQFTKSYNVSQKGAVDFNVTRAAELFEAVSKALAMVEQSVEAHRHDAKASVKAAQQDALGQVQKLEGQARAAVRAWRSDGRRAVRAQREANMPEQLYESHDDLMRDAVGDAEGQAQNVAERLDDSINEYYEHLADELGDLSIDARSTALRHSAEMAQDRLQELARGLGAQAALREAQVGAAEKSWKESHAPQLLAALPQSTNVSSEVVTAQAQEQRAADGFQSKLKSLKETPAEHILSKASDWQTLQELAAASRPHGADSWEKALESNTKKLEKFNNESHKSVLDFNASRAAELADAVKKASPQVKHDLEEQKHNMKAAMKDARHRAHQRVKTLEAEAKTAAKSWKFHGRRAVKAQREARVPEHVYEQHEDRVQDAVGDAEEKAEDAAERLEEKLSRHFEKLEDELGDLSIDAHSKELRHSAEKAQDRLQELARGLGAQAALREAQAAARFGAAEKSWKESHAPQLLLG